MSRASISMAPNDTMGMDVVAVSTPDCAVNVSSVTAVGAALPRLQDENVLTLFDVTVLAAVFRALMGTLFHCPFACRSMFSMASVKPAISVGALVESVPSSYFNVKSPIRPVQLVSVSG